MPQSRSDAQHLADAIRENDLRLGSLVRNNPLPIVVVDEKRRVQMCNAAFEGLFGYCESEITGRRIEDVVATPETVQEVEALGREALASKTSHAVTRRRKKDGSLVDVDLVIVPITIDGAFRGAYAIYRDLTDEKRAQQQMLEALKMRADFVSFVTHQLRTPLAGIKWMLELANDAGDTTEAMSYVKDARESADRLIALVNDLLDASRLESGKIQVVLQPVNLREITDGVIGDVSMLVREKGHGLAVEIPATLPMIKADATLLRQVVLNFISNAIKYTPPAGRIDVAITREDRDLRWTIRDSGIGIPKAAQERLFEKFYRADNAVTIDTEGTGLGLYLVRLIVERFGGRVGCESEEGKGTMFWFTLPLDAAKAL